MSYPHDQEAEVLYQFILKGELDEARAICSERGVNTAYPCKDAPLHVACAALNLTFIKELVEVFGADVNQKAAHDYTPVDAALWHSEAPMGNYSPRGEEIVQYLKSKGAKPNVFENDARAI